MTDFQALVLGLIQGLSEFLPISSSAHLALTPWLFGWQQPGLAFDVALHLGTLIALVWFFWQEWMTLARAFFSIVRKRCIETESERRFAFERVLAVLVELAGRAVEADRDLLAGGVAGLVDRLEDHLDRFLVVLHVGREAALVADRRAHAAIVQQLPQCMERLGPVAQRLGEIRRAQRDDHELLHVEVVVRMRAAVDDVHHRHRHLHRPAAAEVPVQRQARLLSRRLGHRHRHREHRVGAQAHLVVGSVELEQGAVEKGLFVGLESHDRFADLGVDVLDRLEHALAEVAALVAVAQLDRLACPGGSARRHGRPAHDPGLEQHVAFDGGIAARVEDLAADDVDDGAHDCSSLEKAGGRPAGWSGEAGSERVTRPRPAPC